MGRRDAVQVTLEFVAEWRRLGARVTFEPGWETRGNGTSANYEGAVVHHTVGASSEARPLPTKDVLKLGRAGLPGPLCNSAGPWCEDGDPWIHVFAAHPANHAGASGGTSMGPLPVTSLFNPRVWGHEIDYLGTRPMTKGQMKAAVIVGRGIANVLDRSAEYVRAHAETSVTGKWDPGYAPGKTIDMAAFRRNVTGFSDQQQEDDFMSAETEARLNQFLDHMDWNLTPAITHIAAHAATDYPFTLYQDTDPGSDHRTLVVLAAPGVWWPVPSTTPEADYLMVIRWLKLADGVVEVPMRGWWAFAEQMWMLKGASLNIDTAAIESKLESIIGGLGAGDFEAIAQAVNDEDDRRERERLALAAAPVS